MEYKLTEDEIGMLASVQAEVDAAVARLNGLLVSLMRYRKLPDGTWAREGDKLVKQ